MSISKQKSVQGLERFTFFVHEEMKCKCLARRISSFFVFRSTREWTQPWLYGESSAQAR